MKVIKVRNVHEALPEFVRKGPFLRSPQPITTMYTHPRERVMLWPQCDANPWFSLYESLWMLNGQRDVASLTRFVKTMANFSDDGHVFHGAYGHRWRHHFEYDQLALIARNLKTNPSCRRQVLQIYEVMADACLDEHQSKTRDIPHDLSACFAINKGALDITVFSRSTNIVDTSAVHFSMLQEVMAGMIGVPVGRYWRITNNWHASQEALDKLAPIISSAVDNPYKEVAPFRVMSVDSHTWFSDLAMFMETEGAATGYRDPFFRRVCVPMFRAHDLYSSLPKPSRYTSAIEACADIMATDWRMACEQWLQRRLAEWEART